MNKNLLYLLFLILFTRCSKIDDIQTLYYFGDSHFARMDMDWWFPENRNFNLSVSGARIQKLYEQYQGITDSMAYCVVQIGTNNMNEATLPSIDPNQLHKFLINEYQKELEQLSHLFQRTYILSVIPVSKRFSAENIKELGTFYKEVNASIDSITQFYSNVYFVDVQDGLSTEHPLFLDNNLTLDELHLNDLGYNVLAGILRKKE